LNTATAELCGDDYKVMEDCIQDVLHIGEQKQKNRRGDFNGVSPV
jgi:hypothetical protein